MLSAGGPTRWISGADVLAAKPISGLKVATIVWLPDVSAAVVKLAWPLMRRTAGKALPSTEKVNVPEGLRLALLPDTVAVKVTD